MIPTAEDLLNKYRFKAGRHIGNSDYDLMSQYAIEFAKLHVQAALKAAAEEAKVCKDMGELENGNASFEITKCYYDEEDYPIYADENSILNAYPLENIK